MLAPKPTSFLAAALLLPLLCFGEATKLPIGVQRPLYDAARFREISSVRELPQQILALCADHNGRLADPRAGWEPTDAITDTTLPTKRLIWAASDGHYYVVHYERGGRAHSYHVLIATLGQTEASFVWRGVGGPLKNYSAFLRALQAGELDDRLNYAY
jgi:hypothetical protein